MTATAGPWHETGVAAVLLVGDERNDGSCNGRPDGPSDWPIEGSVTEAVARAARSGCHHVVLCTTGTRLRAGGIDRLIAEIGCGADLYYADEDHLAADGRRDRPRHLPTWSPERLRTGPYLPRLIMVKVGARCTEGVDTDVPPEAQLYDLALRAVETGARVAHLPVVISSRSHRGAVPPEQLREILSAHLLRQRIPATAVDVGPGLFRLDPEPDAERASVSIVIPTVGGRRCIAGREERLVDRAIGSIVELSTYEPYEIVVVVDRAADERLAGELVELGAGKVRTVDNEAAFNFAGAINLGAGRSDGQVLILLNDDTEVITPRWIERLTFLLSIEGVGATGALLRYGDGRIQHGGVTLRHGSADNRYRGYPADWTGYDDELLRTTNVTAVTGACLAVEHSTFDDLGGLDTSFPLNFNDVDFCLRLLERGFRVVQDNTTELYHHESATRSPGAAAWELEHFHERWGRCPSDGFDNPNLIQMGYNPLPPPAALNELRELVGVERRLRLWPPVDG